VASPRSRARTVLLGVGGVVLIALAAVLHFVLPQLRPAQEQLIDESWLLRGGALRIAAAAAVSAGAWLLVLAWNSRPSRPVDDEASDD
jgi:protein-S-isoprenylcysteine O-methyltransferase Ste14